jgi:hypothetical protein
MASTAKKINTTNLIGAAADAELHLMGVTHLGEFLQFVRQRAIGGRQRNECDVADLWRAAAKHYQGLQATQAGVANKPKVLPIPSSMQRHIQHLSAQESFSATFSTVPIAFGMVPLAQLVCSQFDLTMSTLEALKKRIPKKLAPTQLAELCLPLIPAHGQCVLGREITGEYVFHSDSHDLRSFTAQLVPVANIASYHPRGHAQAAIVIGVGFSTNVLNVVRFADRLVLNNGYHRVMALLAQGYTHAPCVIQVCSHGEDVGQCAMREISQNSDLYFAQARPPLLRDYLEPLLTSQWPVNPVRRQVTIKISNESRDIAQISDFLTKKYQN